MAVRRRLRVRQNLVEMLPLLAFTGLFVLVNAGESIKYGFLLIYMEEQLHIEPTIRGAVIGIQPFIELCIMPFSVVLGRRIGIIRLMIIATGLGATANVLFAKSGSVFGMFAAQILMGGVWGVFMVLGILVAQRLLPTAVATASANFMSSSALSSALGGVAGGIGVATFGLPAVFLIPAVCSLLAVLGLGPWRGNTTIADCPCSTIEEPKSMLSGPFWLEPALIQHPFGWSHAAEFTYTTPRQRRRFRPSPRRPSRLRKSIERTCPDFLTTN